MAPTHICILEVLTFYEPHGSESHLQAVQAPEPARTPNGGAASFMASCYFGPRLGGCDFGFRADWTSRRELGSAFSVRCGNLPESLLEMPWTQWRRRGGQAR